MCADQVCRRDRPPIGSWRRDSWRALSVCIGVDAQHYRACECRYAYRNSRTAPRHCCPILARARLGGEIPVLPPLQQEVCGPPNVEFGHLETIAPPLRKAARNIRIALRLEYLEILPRQMRNSDENHREARNHSGCR